MYRLCIATHEICIFASLDEINGIFIPFFFKYPLCISIVKNREVGGIHDECFQQYILAGPFLV